MLRVGDWIAVNLTKDEDRTVLTGNLLLVVTGNDNNGQRSRLLAGQAVNLTMPTTRRWDTARHPAGTGLHDEAVSRDDTAPRRVLRAAGRRSGFERQIHAPHGARMAIR